MPLLIEARSFRRDPRVEHPCRCGSVLLSVSGMGAPRAARAAEQLAGAGCRALVSFGTAGALVPGLASGDLLLTTDLRAAGPAACPDLQAADALLTALHDALSRVPGLRLLPGAPLASSDAPIEGAAARRALAEQTGATAVDLESLAIATVAGRRGLPFLAVRCVVDTTESGLPAGIGRHIDDFGRPRWSLGPWALSRPSRLPALVGLGQRMARAGRILGLCARVLVDLPEDAGGACGPHRASPRSGDAGA